MINKKSIVSQAKEINSTDLDEEKVMMNMNIGKYFALNSVGSDIWEKINENICVGNLIDDLTEEYDIDKEVCESSVISFLEKLKENELIEIN